MKIDNLSSERLSILRFPLIVGVVFIHAYNTEIRLAAEIIEVENTRYWIDFFRNLISHGVARVAVPLFFLLSGFFFFTGFSGSFNHYSIKVKNRAKTLLIPFLFWNIITILLIGIAQYLPVTQSFFSGKHSPISSFDMFDYFNAIFGIDRKPILYQFWFIRDLMVMVLITPAIYLLLKKVPKLTFLVLFSLWFLKVWPIYIPSIAACLFFYIGAYLAHSNTNLFTLDRFGPFILSVYMVLVLIDTSTKDYMFNIYIHNLGIIFGISSALFLTKRIIQSDYLKKPLLWASSCSFFVFATHEPLLTVVKKIGFKVLHPSSDITMLLLYLLIPTVVIIISVLSYTCLRTISPKFLSFISGGR